MGRFPSEIALFSPVTRADTDFLENPLKLVPNQALYQAEPQPERSGAMLIVGQPTGTELPTYSS
jgi:hypothetical protein